MKEEISFEKLLNHICSRPGMWTPKGTFDEVYSLILGYSMGKDDTPISGNDWKVFNKYVCIKYGFPTKYVANYVFENCVENDEEAIQLLEKTILEFGDLKQRMTNEEIFEYAVSNFKHEEGEPERIFRIFDKALLEGDEKTIKSLIEEHEHQSILWKGAYPEDVAISLDQISSGQPIKRIYESEDKTKVKLITADFPFPIEMNYKNGNWKIDATKIIELCGAKR